MYFKEKSRLVGQPLFLLEESKSRSENTGNLIVGSVLILAGYIAVFEMNPYLWVGLPGLASDTQTVKQKIEFRK
jgi:hypothetical protein